MAKSSKYSTNLHTSRQSTGARPLIVLCTISLVILTMYLREGDAGLIHSARSMAMTVTSPVRFVGNVLASPFGAVGTAVDDASASPQTLSELRRENERLTAQVAELSEAKNTAERLESLVGLQSTYNLESTAARIIGSTGDAWSNTVIIDKGTTSGLEPGMPVCGAGGVIGQVIETAATTSTVRLITDEQSGVSAMVQSSRAQGMLQGRADGTLRLSYVPADAEVAAGDIIITSGIGGTFPKGLPLGTVSSVNRSPNDVYYTVVVRPASTAEANEEVLVITAVSDEQVASDDDVATANKKPEGESKKELAKKKEASKKKDDAASGDGAEE